MDWTYDASIIEIYLWMRIDLWEIRIEEVYGKEETTKQQKRKSKAAISVWARPNDPFLFYPDVEEGIEYTTAAKLEEFIQ